MSGQSCNLHHSKGPRIQERKFISISHSNCHPKWQCYIREGNSFGRYDKRTFLSDFLVTVNPQIKYYYCYYFLLKKIKQIKLKSQLKLT